MRAFDFERSRRYSLGMLQKSTGFSAEILLWALDELFVWQFIDFTNSGKYLRYNYKLRYLPDRTISATLPRQILRTLIRKTPRGRTVRMREFV